MGRELSAKRGIGRSPKPTCLETLGWVTFIPLREIFSNFTGEEWVCLLSQGSFLLVHLSSEGAVRGFSSKEATPSFLENKVRVFPSFPKRGK